MGLYGRIPYHRIYSLVGNKSTGMVRRYSPLSKPAFIDWVRITVIVIASQSGAVLHDRLLTAIIGSVNDL